MVGMSRWEFLLKIAKLLTFCDQNGIMVVCFTFFRSSEDQLKEYEAGRSQVKLGKHQKWLAMDFCLWEDMNQNGIVNKDEIRWKNDPRYTAMGKFWESIGGTGGGGWTDLNDISHFEG